MINLSRFLAISISIEFLLFFTTHFLGLSINIGRFFQLIIIIASFPFIIKTFNASSYIINYIKIWILYLLYNLFVFSFNTLINISFNTINFIYLYYFIKDYLLLIFQLIVYIYLPLKLISTYQNLYSYLCIFKYIGMFVILIGIIDYLIYFSFGIDLISRHFNDPTSVGLRFHALFGEPRDAAVMLSFLIFIEKFSLFLKLSFLNYKNSKLLRNTILKSNIITFFYLFLIICTNSFSAIIGLIICIIFLAITAIDGKNFKKVFFYIFIISLIIFISINISSRLDIYISNLDDLFSNFILKNYSDAPPVFAGQISNLIPFFEFIFRVTNLEIYKIIIGSGLSSSSMITLDILNEIVYPHSNITRWIYDIGIFGLLFNLFLFLGPIYYIKKKLRNFIYKDKFYFWYIFTISLAIAHRSYSLFVSLSILIIFLYLYEKNN